MNKIYRTFLVYFVLFCAISSTGFSQESDFSGFKERKVPFKENVIKSNIIPLFFGQIPLCGEIRVTYERMLSHNQSLTLGLSYNYPSLSLIVVPGIVNPGGTVLSGYSLRGGRITLGYRFYPLKRKLAPEGLFVGPYGSYNFVKIKERHGNGDYEIWNYTSACVITGYQIHLSKGVFLEFLGGIGYRNNFRLNYESRYKTTSRSDLYIFFENNPLRHVKIMLQINVGFGF